MSIAGSGTDEFLLAWRYRAAPQTRKVDVYSIDGTTPSIDSSFALSVTDEGVFPSIVKMSSNRYLCLFAGLGGINLYLLSKSGTVIAQLDTNNASSVYTDDANDYRSFIRLSDTKAVLLGDDSTNYELVVVDITGDTISFGTVFDLGVAGNYGVSATRMSDTQFFAATDDKVFVLSVSGTTISQDTSLDIRSAQTHDGILRVLTLPQ